MFTYCSMYEGIQPETFFLTVEDNGGDGSPVGFSGFQYYLFTEALGKCTEYLFGSLHQYARFVVAVVDSVTAQTHDATDDAFTGSNTSCNPNHGEFK